MFDTETTALLRVVLDETAKTCLNTKPARGRIAGACRFKDSGNCDERREAIDDLRRVGKSALDSVPCF
jgi:hypothetical protein